MYKKVVIGNSLVLALSISGLGLTACSTQNGASRYGDAHLGTAPVPCGTVLVPCGHVIEYHAVTVTPPPYVLPAPCPAGQCEPIIERPATIQPPVFVEAPIAEVPVIVQPPIAHAPTVRPPSPPPVSCPEGTIPAYGGRDCIPVAIPRK